MYLIANCLLTISLEFNISLWFFFFRVKIDKNWSEQILLDGFWQITCLTQINDFQNIKRNQQTNFQVLVL